MSFDDLGGGRSGRGSTGARGSTSGSTSSARGGATSSAARAPPRGGYQSGSDGDSEYMRLSQQATSFIFTINQNVANLQKMVGWLGTSRDAPEMRDKMHEVQESTRKVIRDATAAIKQLGQFDGGNGNESRERRLQQSKLSEDLKTVLQKFQACYQTAVAKERETVAQQRERADTMRDERHHYADDERASLIQDEQRRNLAQMDAQIEYSSAIIQEREEGIKEIEATMLEVNEVYRDLSTLVVEQGHQLDNIESNMSAVDNAVEAGTAQLTKASHYQKKARNKMCCILIIVVIAAAILTVVLVTTLHKKK